MLTTPHEHSWAIVLAGGDGTRLRSLTADERGNCVPKQFCSLRGGRSLLGDALARAARVVPKERVGLVVTEGHAPFWKRELSQLEPGNVFSQPSNRGTAVGLLFPLMAILQRDRHAHVLVLPSDHYVRNEKVLLVALLMALRRLDTAPERVTLLGITPDGPETDYGWILAESRSSRLRSVSGFVEKPAAEVAAQLFASGAFWNSFMLAARADTLVELLEAQLPDLVRDLRSILATPLEERSRAMADWYDTLDARDFSREILQRSVERMDMLAVPHCGWTDLGTPDRVAAVLSSRGPFPSRVRNGTLPPPLILSKALVRFRAGATRASRNLRKDPSYERLQA